MKRLILTGGLAAVLFCGPALAQFLPPGLPHPDNAGEDVMADHLVDGATIHLVWASNVDYTGNAGNDPDIFYIRFDGSAWSAPVLVNTYGTQDNGGGDDERNPRLTLGPDGVLHCVWQSQYAFAGSGTDWDILYSRRPAAGVWEDAELASDSMGSDAESDIEPNVIALSNGDPLVVWQWQVPFVNFGEKLGFSIRASGAWTSNVLLCQGSCRPGEEFGPAALAAADNGTIVTAFSTTVDLVNGVGTDLDIAYSLLPHMGTWSAAVAATQGAFGDSGEDRDPAVVVLGSGEPGDLEIHIAWASTNDINGNGTEGDILATVIQYPDPFAPTNDSYVVNSNAVGDLHPDDKPSLCVEPSGAVHAAWQTRDAFFGDLDLLHATNASSGGAWSPFELLNLNGLGPDGDDQRVDIECGPGGILSALWQSTDDLGGTVGSDHDLFHALGLGSAAVPLIFADGFE